MQSAASSHTTVIEARRSWIRIEFSEIWKYRELLFFMLWRDVKGGYRQMALGPLWMVLRPVMSMLIFTAIFGGLVRTPTDGLPYPLFFYSALIPWTFFATAVGSGSSCLITNMGLISKVYFPRLIIPVASVLAGLVDAFFSFLLLLLMILGYGRGLGPGVLLTPLFMALAAATALAVGLWVSALSVRFRDLAFVLQYMIQAWMYASPVLYPSGIVPQKWQFLYHLNPIAHVIDGFRWVLLGRAAPEPVSLSVSVSLVLVLLLTGIAHFQRAERTVVDHL
jgi:lipopolysaccharide transport system permease protein